MIDSAVETVVKNDFRQHAGGEIDRYQVVGIITLAWNAKRNLRRLPVTLVRMAFFQNADQTSQQVDTTELIRITRPRVAYQEARSQHRQNAPRLLPPFGEPTLSLPLAALVIGLKLRAGIVKYFVNLTLVPAANVGRTDRVDTANPMSIRPASQLISPIRVGSVGIGVAVGIQTQTRGTVQNRVDLPIHIRRQPIGQMPLDNLQPPAVHRVTKIDPRRLKGIDQSPTAISQRRPQHGDHSSIALEQLSQDVPAQQAGCTG